MEVIFHILRFSALLLAISPILSAQITTFGVFVRTKANPKDKNLTSLRGHLLWDDTARELRIDTKILIHFKKAQLTNIAYADVAAIHFEPLTDPLRRGPLEKLIDPLLSNVADSYMHIGLVNGGSHLLEVDDEDVLAVMAKARAVFGSKVTEDPMRRGDKAVAKVMPERLAAFSLKIAKAHPLPAPAPGKALVWVLTPRRAPDYYFGAQKPPIIRLHANGTVIAVSRQGTYSYAQLDAGDYMLVSQVGDHASAFRRTLEDGKEYFLYQNEGQFYSVALSEQGRDVAMFELAGLQYGEWRKR